MNSPQETSAPSSPPKLARRVPAPPRNPEYLDSVRRRLVFIDVPVISQEDDEVFQQYVQNKYLQYKPRDLLEMDRPMLQQILEWYRPASQPRNLIEWDYVELVASTAEKLLEHM